MRISDWSSDVCSSDLAALGRSHQPGINVDDPIQKQNNFHLYPGIDVFRRVDPIYEFPDAEIKDARIDAKHEFGFVLCERHLFNRRRAKIVTKFGANRPDEMFLHERIPATVYVGRSEEHTSELQSLMRISSAVFCLKKKHYNHSIYHNRHNT